MKIRVFAGKKRVIAMDFSGSVIDESMDSDGLSRHLSMISASKSGKIPLKPGHLRVGWKSPDFGWSLVP